MSSAQPWSRSTAEGGQGSRTLGQGRRLLVVEDEGLTASLLAEALERQGFLVEVAPDVVQARRAIDKFDPDAALLDVSLGAGPTGLDLAFVLARQRPDIAVLILTRHADLRALGVEAADLPETCGFLRKDCISDADYLVEKLELVLGDRTRDVRHDLTEPGPLSELTHREVETLRLMALGYTNEHIASITGASVSTVERWVMSVFRALQIDTRGAVNPRVEAVRMFVAASGLPQRP